MTRSYQSGPNLLTECAGGHPIGYPTRMVTGTEEIERKFEGPGLSPGAFSGLTAVHRVTGPEHASLDATYYDTSDFRLARAGITLRRRSGGTDAGWHAKLPRATEHRTELAVPLSRSPDQVPAELADLLRARTGDRPLRPCAHIVTERNTWQLCDAQGAVLAEVADDSVRAQALGLTDGPIRTWHEVEVELATGGRDLLAAVTDRLAESGITPAGPASKLARTLGERLPGTAPDRPGRGSRAGEVITAYLRTQVDQLRTADIAVRLDEPTGVHDLRVAVRRLRSALRAFGKVIDRDATRPLVTELKWLSDLLGDARDAEVLRGQLTDELRHTPADLVLGPVPAQIDRQLARGEATVTADLKAGLADQRYLDLLNELDVLLASPPYRPAAKRPAVDVLPTLVAKSYQRTERAVEAADRATGSSRDAALHEVRKAAKRLRYATEAVEPVVGRPAAKYRRRAKKVQGVLGEHHDLVTLRAALRELAVQAQLDNNSAFTFGLLHGRAGAAATAWERQFPTAWRKLAAGKARRWLRG